MAEVDGGGLAESGFEFGPPVIVERLKSGNDVGMLVGDVLLLARIGLYVVKFALVVEPPLVGHDGAFAPLDGVLHPLRIGHQNSIGPYWVSSSLS